MPTALGPINKLIQKHDFATALEMIDAALLEENLSDVDKSRLMALAGDCSFKQGHFEEADSEYYSDAADLGAEHPRLWLRPLVGRVRTLLKVPDVNAAADLAESALTTIQGKMAAFDSLVSTANAELATSGIVTVPMLPQRVSVVATRLGYLFLHEGEPEHAKTFFEYAVSVNRHGACRARQGLAKVALAKGEFKKAVSLSMDSIRKGKFQAKTLSAWPILISARRQQDGWRIRDRLIRGLADAPARVRARATLIIVRELRKHDMRQWRGVADEWLANEGENFPRVAKEIQKLILASAKVEATELSVIRAAAQQLLQMPVLGPREWLSGAKELVRTSLLDNVAVDINQLLATAQDKYGDDFAFPARHALALASLSANNVTQARILLQANINLPEPLDNHPPGSDWWAKSVWALARIETRQGNHEDAAELFEQYFETPNMPKRFCLQAQLEWVKELIASGATNVIEAAQTRMMDILSNVQDPEMLMNFARQLQFGPPELKSWGQTIFSQAATGAVSVFETADHPAAAMDILFKLTRRQVLDFGRSADAVAIWESLDAEKQEWLWSGSSVFWEYLGLVFEAYSRSGDFSGAEEFATGILADAAVPAEGLPFVGIPYARQLMYRGRTAEGLALFGRLSCSAPRHSLCAWAWYWLALDAKRQNNVAALKNRAAQVRSAQQTKTGTQDQWELDGRALLLLADADLSETEGWPARHIDYTPPRAVSPAGSYTSGELSELAQHINLDLDAFTR